LAVEQVIVGLNCDLDKVHDDRESKGKCTLKSSYMHRILKAGAIPLPFCPNAGPRAIKRLLTMVDAVILTGGDDYRCAFTAEQLKHPSLEPVAGAREEFDKALVAELQQTDLPVLGICAGMQLMTIQAKGSIFPHIPDLKNNKIIHKDKTPDVYVEHDIKVRKGTLLSRLLGPGEHTVNSRHHQGVTSSGGLDVCAVAGDGFIEAVEDPSKPFYLGVQWHPEEKSTFGPAFQGLFDSLVHAARRGGKE